MKINSKFAKLLGAMALTQNKKVENRDYWEPENTNPFIGSIRNLINKAQGQEIKNIEKQLSC